MMTGTKFDIEKLDGKNDFGLWQVRMKALKEQQGRSKSQSKHIDEFHKLVGDLAAIDTVISDEDQELLLLTSFPSSCDNFVETLLCGRDTLKLEDVLATLNSRELQKMTEAKGDGGEGLYVRGISGQNRYGAGYNHKKSQGFVRNEDQVSGFGADGYDNVDVMMAMSVKELLDWIMDSGSSYYITYMRDYLVDFKDYDGGNILLGDGRECRVRGTGKVQVQMRGGSSFMLDNIRYVSELRRNLISLGTLKKRGFYREDTVGQDQVTTKTLKGRDQLGEYQIGWKIKTGNVLDFCNQRSTQQCTKSGVAKHLGVAVIQQQNGLVKETNVTLLAKVRCFLIQSGLSKVLWAEDTTMSTYLVNRSPSSAIGFKTPVDMLGFFGWLAIKQGMLEPVKVKCIFLGYRKGTGSMQVLQGDEFEVEPQDGHTFEVEPHGNVDHVVGSQEYREDSNEAAFAVAAVEKIYAHESLTFNNTVACEKMPEYRVTSSIVYYWGVDTRVYNEKLVQTLLEGHSILSLEGSLSGDCDVEKNGKWSCIYAVGSQEYQMVCTRPDIASADVGMLDGFDRGLQTDVQVFVDFWLRHGKIDHSAYMTLTEAAKEAIWLKGLAIELGFELKIVAGIATSSLLKAVPGPRFQHRSKLLRIGID
ncbi:zinc finger, CCHC-type containing protein [Tanacetum coccineum]